MKLIQTSIFLSIFMLLTQSIAIPVPDPVPAPKDGDVALAERRFPKLPGFGLPKELCPQPPPQPPVQQTNQCSTGVPYCCSTEGGSHNCVNSHVECTQTVICCNNNFGFQVCMGDIDFNMPINIEINL
ncbi:hypothetical protein RJZ56_007776 [Blastomyces dermatitidis]|uniref:Hydrophobin n=2 Tax=Blastomyces TaxID=229219 RepID=A0A179UGA5_BLAGS|nr:uncharacterized protein BDBG_03180 [Blastomyces gilchristii SLH14081]EGE86620.1 hypothetical protein BDDG_09567 [Blastomyces dermatitidis ATCC 18188]OAT07076.1 hypothetical protein BDBG_03180 [Blastomyces gilchristii SLH14081]